MTTLTAAQLGSCPTVFDAMALLYLSCERVHDTSHFRLLNDKELALSDTDGLFLQRWVDRIIGQFTTCLDQTAPGEILAGNGVLTAGVIADCYAQFQHSLLQRGIYPGLAAWKILHAFDTAFATSNWITTLLYYFNDRRIPHLNSGESSRQVHLYLKMPPVCPFSTREDAVRPLGAVVESACNTLQCFTFLPADTPIEFRVKGLLWSLFDEMCPNIVIAAITPPMAEEDLSIHETESARGVVEWWVEAKESDAYRQQVLDLLHEADEYGVTMAVLPELALSPTLERLIGTTTFDSLRVIVAGSYHADGGVDGRKVNRCATYHGRGGLLWRQCKRHPYKQKPNRNRQAAFPFKDREWIDTNHAQQLLLTPIGAMTVHICLDFLDLPEGQLLCRAGCRLLFVPTYTDSLKSKFRDQAFMHGQWAEAVVAIANNRHVEYRSPREYHPALLYAPLRDEALANYRSTLGPYIEILDLSPLQLQ